MSSIASTPDGDFRGQIQPNFPSLLRARAPALRPPARGSWNGHSLARMRSAIHPGRVNFLAAAVFCVDTIRARISVAA
jgi:hypothetical protein